MKRLLATLTAAAALLGAMILPGAASAEQFGLSHFDYFAFNEDDTPATQAGSHPFAVQNSFVLDYEEPETFLAFPYADIRNLAVEQIAGFVGDATAVPRCRTENFLKDNPEFLPELVTPECANDTAVGTTAARLEQPGFWVQSPVFNLTPPPGVAVRFGWTTLIVRVIVDITIKDSGDHNVVGTLREVPQTLTVYGGALEVWGNPADPGHDRLRGRCLPVNIGEGGLNVTQPGKRIVFNPGPEACPVSESHPEKPFLTLPRSCTGPAETAWRAQSWTDEWDSGSVLTHDFSEPPNPIGLTGCGKLAYEPSVVARTSTKSAETGTGLEFNLSFNDEGLKNPEGLAESETKKAVVTLPEGMTLNPSIGEGLGVCEPDDLEDETLTSRPGEGCPDDSKIGTVRTESPLVEEPIDGEVFLAPQDDPDTSRQGAENPFDSLIAFYVVLRNADLGVLVKLPAKVEPDPETGQIVTTLDDAPQFPVSEFNFRFREGQRAPLISPPACGDYEVEADLYPWSDPGNPAPVVSEFEITSGPGGGPCPPGGVPPFEPGFEAGSLNNNAGSFSPFNMRITRRDGDQDLTKFSSVLPPGVLGSLAGVAKCPDALVALARTKTGREELAAPSCPPASAIGRTLAGAGVGGALTYVPGAIHLGGPYKGAPLSVISITPAVAGPFDAGTVVVQLGLNLNPKTAEVEVDGDASDPIPHILKGIVLKLRDLRVYVDRPGFTLNPTNCDESSAKAILFGSFADVFDPLDDFPVARATRFQAANCLNLGFKPRLKMWLKGGTRRGAHPALRAVYRARPGDANAARAVVTLPRSAFLDQAHIRTICTRVQFAANSCPKGARYGFAKAFTPLLDTPLQGPVYLRSSNNTLPDFVADLKGLVDIEVSARVDSRNGGIRTTFTSIPDAPVNRFVVRLQGGKKGVIVNSRNLCKGKARVNARFLAQNGRARRLRPVLHPTGCKRARKAKRSSHHRSAR